MYYNYRSGVISFTLQQDEAILTEFVSLVSSFDRALRQCQYTRTKIKSWRKWKLCASVFPVEEGYNTASGKCGKHHSPSMLLQSRRGE
jgi:hypothetical protein